MATNVKKTIRYTLTVPSGFESSLGHTLAAASAFKVQTPLVQIVQSFPADGAKGIL